MAFLAFTVLYTKYFVSKQYFRPSIKINENFFSIVPRKPGMFIVWCKDTSDTLEKRKKEKMEKLQRCDSDGRLKERVLLRSTDFELRCSV